MQKHGHDAFKQYLDNTTPLVNLLWKKNIEGKNYSTPEQKALIEKNIKEEVSRITDETVRGYYQQQMKDYVYNELGQGAWLKKRQEQQVSAYKKKEQNTNQPPSRPKIMLDELVLKFVLAAMLYAPELVAEYEEQISMFDINNPRLHNMIDTIFDVYHNNENINVSLLEQNLNELGFERELANLWELAMLRQQKPYIGKLRAEINTKIAEVQLNQLENEIKECLRIMQTSESFPEEVYNRYETLKKEKISLLNNYTIN